MTDQTKPTITPEEAEADLARLEQEVIDGGDVTVADLTAAKERISFAGLVRKGHEIRAEQKRKKEADQLRATTKEEVSKMFTAGAYVDPLVAYDQAVAALDHLVKVLDRNEKLLMEAYRAMSRGGVGVTGWDGSKTPEHDSENFALVGQGEQIGLVVADGVTYRSEPSAGSWVGAAAQVVARKHGGLPVPSRGNLENMLTQQLPDAIKNRAV